VAVVDAGADGDDVSAGEDGVEYGLDRGVQLAVISVIRRSRRP
jgi:hypothetical protein